MRHLFGQEIAPDELFPRPAVARLEVRLAHVEDSRYRRSDFGAAGHSAGGTETRYELVHEQRELVAPVRPALWVLMGAGGFAIARSVT